MRIRVRAGSIHPAVPQKLLGWHRKKPSRNLPWSGKRSAYCIWVSEIMLQQTRVETVIPYYRKFLRLFPTPRALASAPLRDVLMAWEGLGYYARARHLHAAARKICLQEGGRLPRTAAEWEMLPGVGRYTASAIASIAYDEPAAALDVNARRILARLSGYRKPDRGAPADTDLARFFAAARGTAPPGEFFQALMDLGQMVCLPKSPHCGECPVAVACVANASGEQESIPLRRRAQSVPHYDVTAAVIERAGRVLLARRPAGKLLGGMWEFPGGKREQGESLAACLQRELREELNFRAEVGTKIQTVKHAFSHFRITLHVFVCRIRSGEPKPVEAAAIRWVKKADLAKYPMGRADRVVARRVQSDSGK